MATEKKSVLHCNNSNNFSSTERLFNLIRDGENELIIATLLEEDVDIDAKDSKGYTPLLLASELKRKNIAELLITHGANVDYSVDHKKWTVLHFASENGSEWLEIVQSLVKRVSDLNARNDSGESALHIAAKRGRLEIVKCLVEEGADINVKCHSGATPLLWASRSSKDIFQLLLYAGANIDGCIDISKRTVLHCVARNGSEWLEIMQSLLKIVPNINARDGLDYTALHYAALFGNVEIMKCLIKEGADINVKAHNGVTPLHKAACGGNVEIMKCLIKEGADINVKSHDGVTPLHCAARGGKVEIVKCLVEEGADINVKSHNGLTPLLDSANPSRKDVFDLLLNAGANVDGCYEDTHRETVLHRAARFGWMETIQSVVKRVPDINARNDNGFTALHYVAYNGNLEIVKSLVEEGADINATSLDCATPLLCAARTGRRAVVDWLLRNGAKDNICDCRLETVLQDAAYHGWTEVVESLVKAVPDLDARDEDGVAGFHPTSFSGHQEIGKRIMDKKAYINARNKDDKTALLLASRNQKLDVVEYLFQANASCDITDSNGKSPLHYLIKMERPSVKLIKLLIEKVRHLLPADYDAILSSSQLKVDILQDVEFCCQAIVNKYYNYKLPELYKLPVAGSLPSIKRMRIASSSEVFQSIKRTVRFEIQEKGHCNLFNVYPMVLNVLCVKSVLEYYDKKTVSLAIEGG